MGYRRQDCVDISLMGSARAAQHARMPMVRQKSVPASRCLNASCRGWRAPTRTKQQIEQFNHRTQLCKFFTNMGMCNRGDTCQYAHGEHELRLPGEIEIVVGALGGANADSRVARGAE